MIWIIYKEITCGANSVIGNLIAAHLIIEQQVI